MKRMTSVNGGLAGLAGLVAMTLGETIEQAFTQRPNSYVPAHTLERLLGRPRRPDAERCGMNWAMHWGQGALLRAAHGGMVAKR